MLKEIKYKKETYFICASCQGNIYYFKVAELDVY